MTAAELSGLRLTDTDVVQIANALVKLDAPEDVSVAIVPMGTANDFATGLGIPDDPWEALQLATHDTTNSVDVGMVNDQVQASELPGVSIGGLKWFTFQGLT